MKIMMILTMTARSRMKITTSPNKIIMTLKIITTTPIMSAMSPVKSMRIPGRHLAVIEMGTKKIATTQEQKRAVIATTLMNIMMNLLPEQKRTVITASPVKILMSLLLKPKRAVIVMNRVQALRI